MFPQSELVLGQPSLSPYDGPGWRSWRADTFDIADAQWHLEATRFPLAWGCEVGKITLRTALVDHGATDLGELKPNRDAASSPNSPDPHGTRVASIMMARGNDSVGMTGAAWAGVLRYYDRLVVPPASAVPETVNAVPGDEVGPGSWNTRYAAKNGARIINVSLAKDWYTSSTSHFIPTDTLVHAAFWATSIAYRDAFAEAIMKADSSAPAGSRAPLYVVAAGNDATDACRTPYQHSSSRFRGPAYKLPLFTKEKINSTFELLKNRYYKQ